MPEQRWGASWRRLRAANEPLQEAHGQGDEKKLREALEEFGKVLEAAEGDRQTWAEIRKTMKDRAKLLDTQRKRDDLLARTVTAEQQTALYEAMGLLIAD